MALELIMPGRVRPCKKTQFIQMELAETVKLLLIQLPLKEETVLYLSLNWLVD
mgnify:CR=1 FL=1